MRRRSLQSALRSGVMLTASALVLASGARAATEKVLYTFTGGNDGGLPVAALVLGKSGRLYGTTVGGGEPGCGGNGCGTVFMLTRKPGSGWVETVLYRFKGSTDGWNPVGALILDASGNLFGTTAAGGNHSACTYTLGCGTVFELQPEGKAGWKKITLYNFAGGIDGQGPGAPLIFDRKGRLYGTTFFGGVDSCYAGVGCGTVFELTRTKQAGWSERVLYSFSGGADGAFCRAGVIIKAGSLYATTEEGGGNGCYGMGCGTVFELSQSAEGAWSEAVLYRFGGTTDGAFPDAGLVADKRGNLYGTTMQGGDENCTVQGGLGGCGAVFNLVHSGSIWTQSVLYSFSGGADGGYPEDNLAWHDGNLFGTTYQGGGNGCYKGYGCGTVFELKHLSNTWSENILASFDGSDGEYPMWGGVVFDGRGNLYGTTNNGGSYGEGNVFEVRP